MFLIAQFSAQRCYFVSQSPTTNFQSHNWVIYASAKCFSRFGIAVLVSLYPFQKRRWRCTYTSQKTTVIALSLLTAKWSDYLHLQSYHVVWACRNVHYAVLRFFFICLPYVSTRHFSINIVFLNRISQPLYFDLKITLAWIYQLNAKRYCSAAFLNVSQGFDEVRHTRLQVKLKMPTLLAT